jgi:non-specific serine/threonine protein kinase
VLAKRCIPNVSAQFLSAIDWALAVRPQDRPQSVEALRNALGRAAVSPAKTRRPVASVARVPTHAFGPLLATAAVLLAAAIGSALWLRAPSDAAPAHSEVAAAVEPSVDPPFSLLASDPVAGSPVQAPSVDPPFRLFASDAVAGPPVPAPSVAASSALAVKTHGSNARARVPSGERTGPKRKAVATHVAVRGPNELCADRNFFVRPFCIRRLCDEPRFKARAECAPPFRQAALPG